MSSGPGYFSNLRYDAPYLRENIERSTAPGTWRMDPNYYINCNQCQPMNAPINSYKNTSNASMHQVDVESILDGRSRPSSLGNYNSLPDALSPYDLQELLPCPPERDTQYSRYDTPARNVRGLATPDMRLDYPLWDPQSAIFENFSINTKQQARHNFRATWQMGFDNDIFPSNRLGPVMSRDNEIQRASYGANVR